MRSIPTTLRETVATTREGAAWLGRLPDLIASIETRWSLRAGEPFDGEATCSWVAPATTSEGEAVVLKIGFPHMEARDEAEGLAFWAGDPTALLLRADRQANAMLLERCTPGTSLRERPEPEQDEIIARLLRRLWRQPVGTHPFRPLSEMVEVSCRGVREAADSSADAVLTREGTAALADLASSESERVLLATDLHAGNVLSAVRRPWLVIDPKPFLGDPCYDLTQHLINCPERMQEAPLELIARMSALTGVDPQRVRQWAFGRFAADGGRNAEASRRIAARLAC